MYIIATNLTEQEKIEATNKANEIRNHEDFNDDYEYNGNFAIADDFDQWHNECQPCCGKVDKKITLSTGRIVYFCFDYGH